MESGPQDLLLEAYQLAQDKVKRFRSPYSRKEYELPGLLAVIVLGIKYNCDFRDLEGLLSIVKESLLKDLGLSSTPDHVTLWRAFDYVSEYTLMELLYATTQDMKGLHGNIDATGMKRSNASQYYENKAQNDYKCLKTTVLSDRDTLMVVGIHMTTRRRHDIVHAYKLVPKHLGKLRTLAGDKGYDAHKLRNLCTNNDTQPLIPERLHGKKHSQYNEKLKDKGYNYRVLAETVFSMIKRNYGEKLHSHTTRNMKKETILKALVHNLEILIRTLLCLTHEVGLKQSPI